jgi:glyoxylase-like metal-dependent hydrolase (beta-lactamase superfamily II)
MRENIRVLHVGAATVTIVNTGDLHIPPADLFNVSEHAWAASEGTSFTQPLRLPTYSVHVALPDCSLLVDPSVFNWPSDHRWIEPGYQPPPSLVEHLHDRGIIRESVTHVVFTHAHQDHVSGSTVSWNGQDVPTFPNARHYLSRRDWEAEEVQAQLSDPVSGVSRTLGVLWRHGLLALVDGDLDLGCGVQILAAPGESPGHQIVRVHSAGEVLYCVGDLYHHPIEVTHPNWVAAWSDAVVHLESRRTLMARGAGDRAILIATHIPTPGRLEATAAGCSWIAI